MEEEILKLIYDYSKKNRMIDLAYINQLIEIVANSMELNPYIGNTVFLKTGEKRKVEKNKLSISLANEEEFADLTYNFINHDITVYIDKIPKIYQAIDRINLNSDEMPYFKTILYTQRILHELCHANQEKTLQEKKDSFEAKILEPCTPRKKDTSKKTKDEKLEELLQIIARTIIYIKNYKYDPRERTADMDSYQMMLKILAAFPIILSSTRQYLGNKKLQSTIEAYQNTFSPTIQFIRAIDSIEDNNILSSFDWYDELEQEALKKAKEKYSFEQRLRYGLPIEEEKKQKLLHKLKTSKYGQVIE